jgi:hypothetical protein
MEAGLISPDVSIEISPASFEVSPFRKKSIGKC